MSLPEQITNYAATVCEQVRWHAARPAIAEEIENHLLDQTAALQAKGWEENAAVEQAIVTMGDAVQVGTMLDGTHRPRPQWSLVAVTMLLLGLGLLICLLTNEQVFFMRSLTAAGIGLLALAAAYWLDFTVLAKAPHTPFIIVCLLLGLATVAGGLRVDGQLYMSLFAFKINPACLFLLLPTAFAAAIYGQHNQGYRGLAICALLLIIPIFLGWRLPTTSGVFLYVLAAMVLMIMALARDWFGVGKRRGWLVFGGSAVLLLGALLLLISSEPYFKARLINAFAPQSDPQGAGYMALLIRDYLANAHFVGSGTDFARAVFELPMSHTDLLLGSLIYKWGWVTLFGLLAVFALFFGLAISQLSKQKSLLAQLTAASVLLVLGIQTGGYLLNNLGFMLVSTFSLPLISYGGTATVINLLLIGLLLSVLKSGNLVSDSRLQKEVGGRKRWVFTSAQ